MLENVPSAVGHALAGMRAGFEKIVSERHFSFLPQTIALASSAFVDGAVVPVRFTEDGEKISPPLHWGDLPENATGLVLIAEDPDAPTPSPLVHLLAWSLPTSERELREGALASPKHEGLDETLGRNSFWKVEYLPPDPPAGHGLHRYVFQIFALDWPLSFDAPPTREQLVQAMDGHVLAKGVLVGVYERT